jgi:hypothetical protein
MGMQIGNVKAVRHIDVHRVVLFGLGRQIVKQAQLQRVTRAHTQRRTRDPPIKGAGNPLHATYPIPGIAHPQPRPEQAVA